MLCVHVCMGAGGRGGGVVSELISMYECRKGRTANFILRFAESSRGLQRLNKSVLVACKFAGGSVLGTLVLRIERPYIVGKSKKSLDMGEPTFHAEKTA